LIPGKKYKPEDIIEIAWRRRWVVLIPFVAISVTTFAVTAVLPDRYRSSALLLIVPQRVPEKFVASTVTVRLEDRLAGIYQEVLSRTRLENIIQEFNLYPEQRRTQIMEDVVENMRQKDIIFSPPRSRGNDGGSFTISFDYGDARTAMMVTEKLASLFIRENIEDRAGLADQTDQFLQSQLQDIQRELKEREQRLEAFKRAHPGVMPAQMEANQGALQNAQLQVQTIEDSIDRDRDRQILVQHEIAQLTMAAAVQPPVADVTPAATAPSTAARQLEIARSNLKVLRTRYKPDHPDIKAAEKQIRELEQKAAAEALEQPISPVVSGVSAGDTARANRLSDLQTEEAMLQRRIGQKQEEEKRLLAAMEEMRTRLQQAPAIESQLAELMRDYTTLQNVYQGLLSKTQDAKVSANLERRQIGEQFKVLDSARLPQRPISPNRARFNMMGTMFALAIGLGLAALLEYRDTSLRTEDDVLTALSLPVMALVPTMTTVGERQKRRHQRLLIATSGVAVVVLSMAVLAWKFKLLTEWMW
jgi:protein tyrosine kinase modulator